MQAWIGNPPSEWEFVVYSDADFASDKTTSRSTSGVFVCVRASHTFFPLTATSKRQTCVSHSNPEAEIVAADHAVRTAGLPGLELWESLLRRKLKLCFKEDNEATIRIIKTGKSPALRHIGRTHRLDLAFLHETNAKGEMITEYCPTDYMCADVFTKHFTNKAKWDHAIELIGHVDPQRLWSRRGRSPASGGHSPERRGNEDKNAGGKKQAAPATDPALAEPQRTMIEFCCDLDSLLGQPTKNNMNCEVVRLTKNEDVTTSNGLSIALQAIKGPYTLLWGSIPCTGGCPWQKINRKKPGGEANLRRHFAAFKKIWDAYVKVALEVVGAGGTIAFEWPRNCSYWHWPRVKKFIE